MNNSTKFIFILSISFIVACEGPPGPPGNPGPQGNTGNTGPEGNANTNYYTFGLSFQNFGWDPTNRIHYRSLPSSIPAVPVDDVVLMYARITPVGSSNNQYVPLPFTDHYNSSDIYNYLSFSIDSSGRIDFLIRNSAGLYQPYANWNSGGGISCRLFIIESSNLHVMNQNGVDMENMEEVQKFLEQIE